MRPAAITSNSSVRPRGFSLLEVVVGITLLSLLSLFSWAFLSHSKRLYRKIDSSSDAGKTLRAATAKLNEDLINAGRRGINSTSNGIGAQRMGDAIWFLSAYDDATRTYVRNAGGRSFWQKTILYYLTVPLDHDQRYGVSCQSWDQVCPHKILIRKVIDTGTPTNPTSPPENEETLVGPGDIASYLTRPNTLGLDTLSGEPGVVSVTYITGHLLDLKANLTRDGQDVTEANVVLRAGLIDDARAHLRLGIDPFASGTFTLSRNIVVLPRN